MTQLLADRRDIDFVLYEQLEIENILKTKKYSDLNRKMFDMVISEARNLGIKEIYPSYKEGDREGVKFENGKVTVPQCFHRPYGLFVEGEWIAMAEDPEVGGQGFPAIIRQAAFEYISGANYAMGAFGDLGHGTAKMIELFGTPKQKALFLKKVYSGEWGGTMLLTEPGAGSDVGALTTTAVKNSDGTYSISGNKIFITCGDHDLTENIIHPVLARIEGAPPGSKGISLFIVPKIWVNDDGSLGEPNDIVCSGVEEKLGLHGSPTCSMDLGGKGKCRGLLLGEENKGLMIMFHMMNEARLNVGAQGFSAASAAYLYAVDYARERLQGRDIEAGKDPAAPQVPIICHPDVRRMLLQMKAYVDGMRSFVYYVAYCFDKKSSAKTADEKQRYNDFIELLTP
ncbi:MAG: acyl-CoA dehydrogenase family protein, partial [Desulfobacteraceae bacterium]